MPILDRMKTQPKRRTPTKGRDALPTYINLTLDEYADLKKAAALREQSIGQLLGELAKKFLKNPRSY